MRNWRLLVAYLMLGVALTFVLLASARAGQQPPKVRVGTYDSRAIAVAYARSPMCAQAMAGLKARLDQAVANNEKGAKERVARVADRRQWFAHRQVFGEASVDDAMNAVKDKLPTIAKEANVQMIVYSPNFVSDQVEVVDLTDQIVALFEPDERTLKTVAIIKTAKRLQIDFDFED